jgi:hypothetical protein
VGDRALDAVALLWGVACAAAVWALAFSPKLHTDLWFHLAAGREIWATRTVPRTDAWSFSAAGLPWHNHEWLSQLLLFAWQRAFGLESLVYWLWLMAVATALLLYRTLLAIDCRPAVAGGLAIAAAAVGAPFLEIRPAPLSYLLLVAVLRWALLRPRPWPGLPAVFVLWANLHAGFVFGLLAVAVALAARALDPGGPEAPPAARRWTEAGLWTGGCVIGAMVNPLGVRALTYPVQLALRGGSATRTLLAEWLPPFAPGALRSPLLLPLLVAFAAAVVTLVWRRRLLGRGGLALGLVAVAGLALAMALQSRRFVPLFGLTAAPVLALGTAALLPPRRTAGRVATASTSSAARAAAGRASPADTARRRRSARPTRRPSSEPAAGRPRAWRLLGWRAVLPCLVLAAAAVRLAALPLGPRAFHPLVKHDWLPVESLRFAEVNGLRGDLFAFFQWGGYVHWRAAGRLRVFTDPRSETVYPDRVQRVYLEIGERRPGWLDRLEATSAELALWPEDGLPERLLASRRWRELARDRRSVLLARADYLSPAPPRRTPPSPFRTWAVAHRAQMAGDLARAERLLAAGLAQPPPLVELCRDLAAVTGLRRGPAAAEPVADRCQAIYPDRAWRRRLAARLEEFAPPR